MEKTKTTIYMQPQTEVVCMKNAGDLLEEVIPGASYVKNADDETPVPVVIGNPDEIGAKSWYHDNSGHHTPNLWDD